MTVRTDQLHNRPNGWWSEGKAEWNKWIFLKAYMKRIDAVAERRAFREAEVWLQKSGPEAVEESSLLRKWKANPPETEQDWKYWIALHQRHLFTPLETRGSFYRSFPALREKDRRPDYELTRLFYEALRKRAE